ncbi:MAG: heat-inducible transcriptional repressor HrcA [Tissierellia bacterium]|nr:heat-inducible transcriptional repressor HrcA [Tissierellia bacterium]MDD4780722.1 heat-inducible transcriptional repressor HrcA [Tissierellia bacterium]
MSLDKRKILILKAIISSYIDNAEAVGSRTISKKYELGVSPATIRNEMSDLEEMGFLVQPHTSSGRIPTDKAYRYFVDDLWKNADKSRNPNVEAIRKIIDEEASELDSIFNNSVRILSQITRYTSFIVAPHLKKTKIKRIQLVSITENKIMLIIVMESNIVRQVVINLRSPIPEEQLHKISVSLSERISGHKIEDVNLNLKEKLIKELYNIKESSEYSLIELVPFLMNQIGKMEDIDVYSDGITNILGLPEYNDLEKAKEFISFAENKDSIVKLFQNAGQNDLDISIGNENPYDELKDCSLITATYKFNGKIVGKIGVVGPTRMDYEKVISTVKSISEIMNEIIDRNFTDGI